MNTRVILVDDNATWSKEHCTKLADDLGKNDFPEPEVHWVNPHEFPDDDELVAAVQERSENERWDAILIDVDLGRKSAGMPALLLPINILAAFRRTNRAALALIYSGTMRKHLQSLFSEVQDESRNADNAVIENHIRQIFADQVSGFFSRDDVIAEVIGEMRNPPLLLRVDRMLQSHAVQVVKPEEAEFSGSTFDHLARAVRQQDVKGQRIARLVVEYGISAFLDLNA
jgi:hypothetical protein